MKLELTNEELIALCNILDFENRQHPLQDYNHEGPLYRKVQEAIKREGLEE